MRIQATVKITYEVKPENYTFATSGDRNEQILNIEHTLLSAKIDTIRHFSPFMFPYPVIDVSVLEKV